MKNIKYFVEDYQKEFNLSEKDIALLIIASLLNEINQNLSNIANRMYE